MVHFSKYLWTALWILVGFFLGFILLLMNGQSESFRVGAAMIWATAYFFCGCLLGFIFGVPKIISLQNTSINNSNLSDSAQRAAVQENNNLTDISDWLTKVLVGASLVQLQSIPHFVMHVARRMGEGLCLTPSFIQASIILSAGILLYYTSFGFLSGYLTMRLVIHDFLTNKKNNNDEHSESDNVSFP